jgi:HK97 family phage major capsid protein
MSVITQKMREERANLHSRQQEILDGAGEAGLSAEQTAEFDRIHEQQEKLAADIQRIERHESVKAELEASRGVLAGRQDTENRENADAPGSRFTEAFGAYLRSGNEYMSPEQRAAMHEKRAQATQTDSAGGYLVPEGFSNALEKAILLFGGVEQAGTAFDTDTGNDLPWPTVNDTTNKGRLLAENAVVTATDVTFGVVNFAAYKYSSDIVLVPSELIQDSAFDLDVELPLLLGERIGRIKNQFGTTGTGTAQPQGVVTGSTLGVTAASATAVTYDELVDLMHSVDPGYRQMPKAGWMFNDTILRELKQLKDSQNRPLWLPSVREGDPDTFLGKTYTINQDMASPAINAKTILFGDFGKFRIRNVRGFALRRLSERYADNDQVGFVAFTRSDSRLINAGTNPIKHLVQAAV